MIATRGDVLVERLLRYGSRNEEDASELIAVFGAGYPVGNLRRLFSSNRDDVVRTAAWVASELGELALPILPELRHLLNHRVAYVRAFVLDAILLAASPANGEAIADAVRLIDDDDEGVRWKTMNFLTRATVQQLRASVPNFTELRLAGLVKWLLEVSSQSDLADIINRLKDRVPTNRRFAGAAAARVAARSLGPLEQAAESSDEEVRSFAREWIRKVQAAL